VPTRDSVATTEQRQPIEQLLIQLLFQLMDLLAKRRLRHMFASDEPAEVGSRCAACEKLLSSATATKYLT
jgi:hypothetical protein